MRNKLLILLPAALVLSYFLPGAIMPLLMLGGAYLCYEGVEKVYEAVFPHKADAGETKAGPAALDAKTLEDEKVAGAIKTDFILSAEIMAITLAAIPPGTLLTRALVLAVVAVAITAAVYGSVALIVKADDVGLALAKSNNSTAIGRVSRGIGRALVLGMPYVLFGLSVVGTAAMIWVGGGIIVHGLATYGVTQPEHAIHAAAVAVAHLFPPAAVVIEWIVSAIGAGLVGLLAGAATIPVTQHLLAPAWTSVKRMVRRGGAVAPGDL